MAEAQGSAIARTGDVIVGLLDDLPEQVTLTVGLCATVPRTVAEEQIPVGIILYQLE